MCSLCLLLCWRKIAIESLEGVLRTVSGLGHRMHLTTEESRQRKNLSEKSGLVLLRLEVFILVRASFSSCAVGGELCFLCPP